MRFCFKKWSVKVERRWFLSVRFSCTPSWRYYSKNYYRKWFIEFRKRVTNTISGACVLIRFCEWRMNFCRYRVNRKVARSSSISDHLHFRWQRIRSFCLMSMKFFFDICEWYIHSKIWNMRKLYYYQTNFAATLYFIQVEPIDPWKLNLNYDIALIIIETIF